MGHHWPALESKLPGPSPANACTELETKLARPWPTRSLQRSRASMHAGPAAARRARRGALTSSKPTRPRRWLATLLESSAMLYCTPGCGSASAPGGDCSTSLRTNINNAAPHANTTVRRMLLRQPLAARVAVFSQALMVKPPGASHLACERARTPLRIRSFEQAPRVQIGTARSVARTCCVIAVKVLTASAVVYTLETVLNRRTR